LHCALEKRFAFGRRFALKKPPRFALGRKKPWSAALETRAPFGSWFSRPGVLICTLLLALAPTRRACAAAGQWQAGARAGVAWLDGPRAGPSAEAFLRYGLGEAIDLDLQLLTSLHPFQPDAKLATGSPVGDSALPWVAGVSPGLLYRWDVLRIIPFAGAGVGAYHADGLDSRWEGTQFGVSARAGVEYLLSRDVVLSAQLAAHLALTESPLPAPWIQLGVGASYAWGW
jgi:hypothetical protein